MARVEPDFSKAGGFRPMLEKAHREHEEARLAHGDDAMSEPNKQARGSSKHTPHLDVTAYTLIKPRRGYQHWEFRRRTGPDGRPDFFEHRDRNEKGKWLPSLPKGLTRKDLRPLNGDEATEPDDIMLLKAAETDGQIIQAAGRIAGLKDQDIPTESELKEWLAERTAGELDEDVLSLLQFQYDGAPHVWLPSVPIGESEPTSNREMQELHELCECEEDENEIGANCPVHFEPVIKPSASLYRCLNAEESKLLDKPEAREWPLRSPFVLGIRVKTEGSDDRRLFPVEPVGEMKQVVDDWLNLPRNERPTFPVTTLLKMRAEWKTRQPESIARNTRKDRTIPSGVAMVNGKDRRAGKLLRPAMYVDAGQDDGQLIMPGFSPVVAELETPALPLVLYDLGIGQGTEQRGRGAPLPLRIWVESILSISLEDRRNINKPVALEVPLGEFLEAIWATPQIGKRGLPRRNEYVPLLDKVALALASPEAKVPWLDWDTGVSYARNIVLLNDFPRTGGKEALKEGRVRIIVDLPPSVVDGPIVSPRLRFWGITGAAHYRALLGLSFSWWHPGKTHFPVGRGKRRHWVPTENPTAYGDKLTDAGALALCFPTSTRSQRRNLVFEAWRVLADLVVTGEAREVDGRFLPPVPLPPVPKRGAKTLRWWLQRYRKRK